MIRIRALIAMAAALCGYPLTARAQLMVAPTRVVLTPAERTAELAIVNKGDKVAAFRIGIENRRMLMSGEMEPASDTRAGELFAADKLRVTPRQLTLQPGERQTVRVTAQNAASLPDGEYRAHLRLMSAPLDEAKTTEIAGGDDKSIAIQLIAIRSITLPVIIRAGKLTAEAKVASARFEQRDANVLAVRLERRGSRSIYGNLNFTIEGEAQPAYYVRGVAVYVPNDERDVLVPLPGDVRKRFAGRRVRIDFVSGDGSDEGARASTTVAL